MFASENYVSVSLLNLYQYWNTLDWKTMSKGDLTIDQVGLVNVCSFTSTLRGIIAPSEFTVTIQLNLPNYDDLCPCGLSALRNDPR